MKKVFASTMLFFFLLGSFFSGCATSKILSDTDPRREELKQYERVFRNGDEIIIYYGADISGGRVHDEVTKWSTIRLSEIPWRKFGPDSYPTSDIDLIPMELPSPDVSLPSFTQIPILKVPSGVSVSGKSSEVINYYFQSSPERDFLSVHVYAVHKNLAIFVWNREGVGELLYAGVAIPARHYDKKSWATPGNVLLLPFAVLWDVITSPVQLAIILIVGGH